MFRFKSVMLAVGSCVTQADCWRSLPTPREARVELHVAPAHPYRLGGPSTLGGPVALRLGGHEFQRNPIDAVTLAGGRRTVVKHVAEMPAAAAAMHLLPYHAEGVVRVHEHSAVDWRIEARPA